MAKVPVNYQFYDFSDYARPFGYWVVERLINTSVTSIHVTLAFIAVGFLASYLYVVDTFVATVIAGMLLLLKSGLDAADGALARAQNRPSKVGRFMDSIGDFAVNVTIIWGITATMDFSLTVGVLFFIAVLASVTWQGTVYNFYYVTYRWQHGGDTTSSTDESKLDDDLAPWDNIHVLRVLHRLYLIIYAWQDSWMVKIEKMLGTQDVQISKNFMVLCSVLGLGTQLAIVSLFSFFNQPEWALYSFLIVFNLYWIALVLYRRMQS